MKNIIIALTVVIISVGLFSFLKTKTPKPAETPNTQPTSTSSPSNPNVELLKAGGSSYSDHSGLYSFLYPSDYSIDIQDIKHPRIYKRGETQRPQSEMSDGALMVLESIDLGTQTLEQWVDSHIKQITADGTTEMVQSKKPTTVNGFQGFTYEVRGLGASTYVVLQKNSQSTQAVSITYAVSDPEGKGYQSEIDATLSTFELLK